MEEKQLWEYFERQLAEILHEVTWLKGIHDKTSLGGKGYRLGILQEIKIWTY